MNWRLAVIPVTLIPIIIIAIQFDIEAEDVFAIGVIPFTLAVIAIMARTIQIAYVPNGRVFGISKLVRVVEKFSKRLQIQERITKNIADELYAQGVKGVAVVADAEHLCMKMRGVKNDAKVTTSAFRGTFEDQKTKEELLKAMSH